MIDLQQDFKRVAVENSIREKELKKEKRSFEKKIEKARENLVLQTLNQFPDAEELKRKVCINFFLLFFAQKPNFSNIFQFLFDFDMNYSVYQIFGGFATEEARTRRSSKRREKEPE